MSRPLRIQYEGAYYHATCRGNERRAVFRDDADRSGFLDLLERSSGIYGVRVLCFVLMSNHFHLVVQTLKPNLSEFMRHLNISYTASFNRRHRRSGHLYQGRYHAILIEKDAYLVELSRYVHLNPVRVRGAAGESEGRKIARLAEYQWSSYPGYISTRGRRKFVDYSDVLEYFGGDNARGRSGYRSFVTEGIKGDIPNPLKKVVGRLMLGSEEFAEQIRSRFPQEGRRSREQPGIREISPRREPEDVLTEASAFLGKPLECLVQRRAATDERGLIMELLYRHCDLTQVQIGRLLGGLDYSTVSVSRKQFLQRLAKSKSLQQTFDRITRKLQKV